MFVLGVFFVKQKTAYEMRISDWSSDVCSSDLNHATEKAIALFVRELRGLFNPTAMTGEQARRAGDDSHPVWAIESECIGTLGAHFTIGRASCRERVCQYV